MILTHKISLSLNQRGERQSIDAVQGDSARAVEISLQENGAAWAVPEGVTAVIRYRRGRDGTGGVYDTLLDGSAAYAVAENVVTVYLTPQVLAVSGPVELQVTLLKDGAELTCFSFWVHVQGKLGDAEDGESYVNLEAHIRAAVEKMDLAKRENSVYYVAGDDTSTAGTWTGTCEDITEYFDGLMIAYRTAANGGSSSTTLNINGLGAVPVKRNGLSYEVNYYYQVNSVLFLTYVVVEGAGCWQITDIWWIDSDRKTSAVSSTAAKLILIGSKGLSVSGQITFANPLCYIGTDNCLYSGGHKVVTEDSIPGDVPEYVRTEAERLAALVQSRQNANTVTMMLGADIHARLGLTTGSILSDQMLESTLHAAQAMKIIRDQVHLDLAGLLGDYIWDEDETAEQAMEMFRVIHEYFSPAFNGLPQFWCKGNHDMLPSADTELNDDQVFSAVGIHNSGAIYDSANRIHGYFHRDFDDYKLRVVCMNTTESYDTAVNTLQNDWLKTVLDVDGGWKVIILSHIPLDWWGTEASVYQTVAGFADNILCNIHGHTHNYVTGLVGDTAIPRIAVPNIDFYQANAYADNTAFGEDTTYNKTAGSAADTAFCIITIDLEKNKLYADHYGGDAGYDREVDLNTGIQDNQIPLSTSTFGGTEIYNGVGYKTGYRINSSFAEVETTGMCCTGFIAVSPGDVLRVKNVILSGGTTAYLVTYTTIGGNYSAQEISALGEADANGVYSYTIPANVGAIRLSVGVIDDTSIITINKEIV